MRRLAALLLVASVVIGISGSGAAWAADSQVLDTLALVPSWALYVEGVENKPFLPGSVRAAAVDMRVVRSFTAADPQAWQRLGTGLSPRIFFPAAGLSLQHPERWHEAVGVDLDQVAAILTFGDEIRKGAVWVLPDESVASRLLAHLRTRGFVPGEDGWLVNGDVSKLDLHNRAPVDPFRGAIGESFNIRQDGRLIYQQKLINAPPALPVVQAAFIAARDALHEASQEVTLVQAMAVSLFVEAPDVARAEDMQPGPAGQPRSQAEVARLWEAEWQRSAAAVRIAIPFTPLAVVADFEDPAAARRGVIVALPYKDCGAARTANARFPGLWQVAPSTTITSMARPDAVVTTALVSQDHGCTAVIRISAPSPAGTVANPVWRYLGSVLWEKLPGPFAMAPP